MPDSSTHPSPAAVMQAFNAFQVSACLKGAIELDLFTAVGEGKRTAEEIAQRCGASVRGVVSLANFLVVTDFLAKDAEGYRLTPVSEAFLDTRSPACMASTATFLLSATMQDAFKDVAAAVRRGGTVLPGEGSMDPEHPCWVEFARSMAPMMAMQARLLAEAIGGDTQQKLRVLDVAAGHGLFGIAVAQRYPDAVVTGLDWRSVLTVARENAENAGVSDRYHAIDGSAFDAPLGDGYDAVLLPNFLHHFDPATCERLLRRIHAALRDNGRVFTVEFIPNEDRVSPPSAAAFAMVMLASTAHGDAYTFRQFEQMFQAAGFPRSEMRDLSPTPQRLIISSKQ
ncbi:MAG: methyltransferase domain-containing protein [Chloroflexi bacterium]|nr:methyltransferase domain-containing protein [Chloroflexota bacterium]